MAVKISSQFAQNVIHELRQRTHSIAEDLKVMEQVEVPNAFMTVEGKEIMLGQKQEYLQKVEGMIEELEEAVENED